jgi:hypothetical protein
MKRSVPGREPRLGRAKRTEYDDWLTEMVDEARD